MGKVKKMGMKIVEKELKGLKPAEYNPRVELKPGDEEYENIRNSIEAFGYVDPIIINKDGTIISGHQRYNVLLDLGITKAEVSVVDLNKDKEMALNVAMNKISGEWDMEKLKEVIGHIQLSDIDVHLAGFGDNELKEIIGEISIDDDMFFEDQEPIEIKEGKKCKCPNCGFEFETL